MNENEFLWMAEKLESARRQIAQEPQGELRAKTGYLLSRPLLELAAVAKIQSELQSLTEGEKSDREALKRLSQVLFGALEILAQIVEMRPREFDYLQKTIQRVEEHEQHLGTILDCLKVSNRNMNEMLDRIKALEKKQSQLEA